MQIPLIKGIIGVKTNPHIDSPIKNEISININVEDMEETNVSNKFLDKLSLKSLKNKMFINFKIFLSANFISTAPKNIPLSKIIDKKISNLLL